MDMNEALAIVDKRAEEEARKQKIVKVIKEVIIAVQINLIGAWFLMIGVGVVHHEWLPDLPTLGWWLSLLIYVLGDFVFNCWAWGARVKVMR